VNKNNNFNRFLKVKVPAEFFVLPLQLILVMLIFYWRVEIAGVLMNHPTWLEPQILSPFTPDEVTYLSGEAVRQIDFGEFFKNFLNNPGNINLWGNFVYYVFVKNGFGWKELVLTNIFGYLMFSFLVFKILKIFLLPSKRRIILYTAAVLNPTVLQVTVSSLRDIWIFFFYVLVMYAFINGNYLIILPSLILLGMLRFYMVAPALLFVLILSTKKRLMSVLAALLAIFGTFLILSNVLPNVYEVLVSEWPQRIIEGFTGISLWLILGRLNFYGSPYVKLEHAADYFYAVSYAFLWSHVFLRKALKKLLDNSLFLAAFFSSFFLIFLHTVFIGFFVGRILYLIWFPTFVLTLAHLYAKSETK
jgi:hypothetical protein